MRQAQEELSKPGPAWPPQVASTSCGIEHVTKDIHRFYRYIMISIYRERERAVYIIYNMYIYIIHYNHVYDVCLYMRIFLQICHACDVPDCYVSCSMSCGA